MDKVFKQIIAGVAGATITALAVWIVMNWMSDTTVIVLSVAGAYVGYKLIK